MKKREKEWKNYLDIDQISIASLFSKNFRNEEATYELHKIVELENKVNRDELIYKTSNKLKNPQNQNKQVMHLKT